ncbi:enoyl-CoA hydratase-related protein [Desulfofundulus thermosubterraneus]|uniref:short-chain-enoyl-CoA hydratase n=1 Tax=Desulfofundulus thermosubterraneus DSM 16057 TaxID=1121432 RepID=A0A1M6IJJ0_9FIRM|nr:enoyl-CoA hydratase-related protein [Desulfofundulus thermosubterraneus]SHJ34631.1 Enoyl-CoA hydratase/carnithine racemase [Desulfofundulus thermosubterraneus DSM 16057]
MNYETIKVERGQIGIIFFNRPQALNALSTQMARELVAALEELELDDQVFAAVLTAEGDRAFCVGADLKERKNMTKAEVKKQRTLFIKAFEAVVMFPKPLVAAVNGYALGGGCEFALGCDFIIASEKAFFGLPEVSLAVIPAGGGTQLLPRVIGRAKAKELIFTGRRISAAEAYRLGMVNYVVPAENLMARTMEIMQEIVQNGPIALQQAKRAINLGLELDLHTAFALEAECYNVCLATEDRDEGLRAFNEKRKPVYRNR